MKIQQFEDKYLAHYSYAILSERENKVVLIDPSRNPAPYYEFAKANNAVIVGVIETHPHADFVSSHLEIHQTTGAKIYAHPLTGASYPFQSFEDGNSVTIGEIKFKSLHTPGHSPDSISIILEHEGKKVAVFTGDTLFIGDCGRPDLREGAGNITAKREELALQMYDSLRNKLMQLADNVIVYPAHGAGTLCGKALSNENHSTIGAEKITNWSLQQMSAKDFVTELTTDQPFIPKYFGYDVELNRKGAPAFSSSVNKVKYLDQPVAKDLNPDLIIVDSRTAEEFKKGHLPNSINLMTGNKFETWLGSIIKPGEQFYLSASSPELLKELIDRSASIGYEGFIEAAFLAVKGEEKMVEIDVVSFKAHPENFTIIDIRNATEVKNQPIFVGAKNIPLGELRERINEIATDKPIIIHCAGGYRSAAGSSIVNEEMANRTSVFDLGEAISDFYQH